MKKPAPKKIDASKKDASKKSAKKEDRPELQDPVTEVEAFKVVTEQRKRIDPQEVRDRDTQKSLVLQDSKPDHPVEDCMPKFGVLPAYCNYAKLQAGNGADIYHLGACIPTLLNELNLRGFSVNGVSDYGRSRPLTVFALLLGPSGDGKSTSAMTAINHICHILDSEDEANNGPHAHKRKLEFDGTPEGLRHALIHNFFQHDLQSTVALLYHEELTTIFSRSTGHVAEFLQRLYDGRSLEEQQRQHQRAQSEGQKSNSVIKNPKVNAVFCSTPDNLAAVVSKTMASGGLYGRLLIFVGEDRPQVYEGRLRRDKDLQERALAACAESERWITEWSAFLDAMGSTNMGKEIQISPEADAIFEAWHGTYQDLIHATRLEDNLRSMLARAPRTAWTIAGLYATTQLRMVVGPQDALEACRLVDRCFHMGKVLDRRLGQSEESKLLDALYSGIRARGSKGVAQSHAYDLSGIANKGITRFQLKEMLETLVEARKIVRVDGPKPSRGPTPTYYYDSEIARELPLDKTAN